ncbi:U3 small nucleolar RNA-associated protein 15 [Histomonas meleagridis]|uniref:U3 small nucleolar RNA-associated protein 15 n=1 Tax=Histomonas meleagridis TaxID=135588 RepID=UPI003559D4E7|nr:U3 small nucleolar RNA-associated protein 15 [Histomonas meleagridis]KAH0800010.1 U3 small nucleolar RNA-associated protein 15 [Histomonas meleagridis]
MKVFQKYGAVPFSVGEIRTKTEIEESTVWQKLKENEIFQFNSAINQIKFSPVAPYSIVALSGLSGPWIDGRTHQHKFSFAKTKTPFTSVAFRKDGILIALGREDGTVDIYPTEDHQTLLKRFKLNSGVVFSLSFSPFANEIIAGTGNGQVHIIDISQRKEIEVIQAHNDAVSGVVPLESGNIWVTSSHDGAIKIWDFSKKECLSEIVDPNYPITHITLCGNRAFASSGECVIVVDIKAKATLVSKFVAHTRPIVGMTIVRSNLVTASGDRTIKVFDPSSFSLLFQMKLHSDITAFDAKSDASAVAIGLSGGVVQLKFAKDEEIVEEKNPELSMPANFRVLNQYEPRNDAPYNRELKRFNEEVALDSVLEIGDTSIIIGMLDELDRLGRLDQAISNRDPGRLMPLLKFLTENVTNPAWSQIILKTVASVEKIYRLVISDNPRVGSLFDKLVNTIRNELEVQKRASRLVGKIDVLLSNKLE